ncbi:MAG: MFS transporter [Gammaproteobacteria bacterium]
MALIKRFPLVLSASLASTIGGVPFNTLPVVLDAMGSALGLTAVQSGDLAGTLFAGYFAGTLLALVCIDRVNWRWLTIGSAVVTALAYFASGPLALVGYSGGPLLPLSIALAILGLASSLMTALGLRVLAQLPEKEQAFGFRQSTELWLTAGVLFGLQTWVTTQYGYGGIVMVLGLMALVLSTSAITLPRGPEIPGEPMLLPRWADSRLAWAVLAVFFVYLAGNIGLWAFLGEYSKGANLTPEQSGIAFAVLKVLGGVAAAVVAVVGSRLGLLRGQAVALVGLTVGLLLLHGVGPAGFAGFAGGAWTWEFFFTVGCILQTATIARLDPSGRLVVLVPAAFAASSMVSPPIAGRLLANFGADALLWAAFAASVIPVLVYPLLLRRAPANPQVAMPAPARSTETA